MFNSAKSNYIISLKYQVLHFLLLIYDYNLYVVIGYLICTVGRSRIDAWECLHYAPKNDAFLRRDATEALLCINNLGEDLIFRSVRMMPLFSATTVLESVLAEEADLPLWDDQKFMDILFLSPPVKLFFFVIMHSWSL